MTLKFPTPISLIASDKNADLRVLDSTMDTRIF